MKQGMQNNKSKPKTITELLVTEQSELLDFLLKKMSHLSRNSVKSMLTRKEVSVNGKTVSQHDYLLKEGQTVRIAPPNPEKAQREQPPIIYEDEDLIVINKPAGLLSVGAGDGNLVSAYRLLTDYVRESNPKGRIFVVHRLDRDTSGVLLFAKNERMKLALQDNWGDLVAKRCYVAVVEGVLDEKSGRIRSWLKETKTLMMYSSKKAGDGLEAITNYRVTNETADYSLLDLELETGRKNQIRVHMKEMGHSVAGDRKYGALTDPLKRLGLHAYKLELTHPFSGKMMHFEAKVPKSFKKLFQ